MSPDRTRTLRGALAGAAAAGVWALQQPADRRVFGVPYDDVELLGRAVVRGSGRGWLPAGLAMHLFNGALFGAVYARLAPSVPVPPVARGIGAGMAECFPQLWGSRAAFAQATWRHVLFGAVLGGLESRLNPPAPAPA